MAAIDRRIKGNHFSTTRQPLSAKKPTVSPDDEVDRFRAIGDASRERRGFERVRDLKPCAGLRPKKDVERRYLRHPGECVCGLKPGQHGDIVFRRWPPEHHCGASGLCRHRRMIRTQRSWIVFIRGRILDLRIVIRKIVLVEDDITWPEIRRHIGDCLLARSSPGTTTGFWLTITSTGAFADTAKKTFSIRFAHDDEVRHHVARPRCECCVLDRLDRSELHHPRRDDDAGLMVHPSHCNIEGARRAPAGFELNVSSRTNAPLGARSELKAMRCRRQGRKQPHEVFSVASENNRRANRASDICTSCASEGVKRQRPGCRTVNDDLDTSIGLEHGNRSIVLDCGAPNDSFCRSESRR